MFGFLFNFGNVKSKKKSNKKHSKRTHTRKRKGQGYQKVKGQGPFGPAPPNPHQGPFGPAPQKQGPPPPLTPFAPPPQLPPPPPKSKSFSRKHKHHKSAKHIIHFGLNFGLLPKFYKQTPPPMIYIKKYNPYTLTNYDYRIDVNDKAKYNDGIEYMLKHLYYYYFYTYYKRTHYLKKDVFKFTVWNNKTFMDTFSEMSTSHFKKVRYLGELPSPIRINPYLKRNDMYYLLFFHYIPDKLQLELIVKYNHQGKEMKDRILLETDTTVLLNHGCEYKLNVIKNKEIGSKDILMTRLILLK